MPKERDPPYVAAGFREDAGKLIRNFMERRSAKFEHFAELWRDFGFSTIFMGRENFRELTEFTEECYRNTLLFLDCSDTYEKLGAVFLLYALYLKQPLRLLRTPVPIAVTPKQVIEICTLEEYFTESNMDDDILDVPFVITKLLKMEAMRIHCLPIPMGPLVPIPLLKLEPLRCSFFKNALGSLSMINEKEIKNISELSKQYEKLKKTLPFLCSTTQTTPSFYRYSELRECIRELEVRYNTGLLPNKLSGDLKMEDEFRRLGQRRAAIKSRQFERAAEVGMQRRIRVYTSDSSPSKSPPPPVKRGRGRPRKMKKGKRARKKYVEVQVKREEGVECNPDEGAVDNPDSVPVGSNALGIPHRRPSKFPRPVRKHYFKDD